MIDKILPNIEKTFNVILNAYKNNKRVYTCGNGGSACDAMHFAEELVARYEKNRPALPAQALVDAGTVTCCGNDFGYDSIFSRQIEAYGKEGDVLVAISTSGNSVNVLNAVTEAKKKGMKVIGFTGKDGGKLKDVSDVSLIVPSNNTARIQESHITIIHILCEQLEKELFGNE